MLVVTRKYLSIWLKVGVDLLEIFFFAGWGGGGGGGVGRADPHSLYG